MKNIVIAFLSLSLFGCQNNLKIDHTELQLFANKIQYPISSGEKTILILNVDGCGGCLDLIANKLNSFDYECDNIDLILISRERSKFLSYNDKFKDYSAYFDRGGDFYQILPKIESLHYLIRINEKHNIEHQSITPENIEDINTELTIMLQKCNQ